ncbi:MAG: hypothetical protein ABI644_12280 [Arenimonas sp.]
MAKKVVKSIKKKSKPKAAVKKTGSSKVSKLLKPQAPVAIKHKPLAKTSDEFANSTVSEKPAKKSKLVRDSFTIPKDEYLQLAQLKQRALLLKHEVKKSELLRAGISILVKMTDAELVAAVQSVLKIKTGRPMKSKGSSKPAKEK